MILTLLDHEQLWFNVEGVVVDFLAMETDFGVVGVECSAMVDDLKIA
jgi:hypothetical protein